MDQMGEVEYAPGEPKGTAVAPAPRLRDRHLHHRRRLRPPGQPRRRRHDHQRRHPVDDRRLRAAAHRDAAGVAGAAGRPVPRHPALGEPAARRQVEPAGATRTSAAARSVWPPRRRRCAGPRDRRRGRCDEGPRLDVHPDDDGARHRRAGCSPRPAVGGRLQRARLRALRRRHRRRREASPVRMGNLAVLGAGDFVTVRRRRAARTAVRRPSTCSCSVAGRSASRSRGPGRS